MWAAVGLGQNQQSVVAALVGWVGWAGAAGWGGLLSWSGCCGAQRLGGVGPSYLINLL